MNEILKLKIDDLDMLGRGIAHIENKTVFVENALIGEEVEAKIINQKQGLLFAKNLKTLKESSDRTIPVCPYFFECGGCDIQHLKYEKSLEFKKNQLINTFKKVANYNLEDFEIVESSNKYYYRNKIALKINDNNNKAFLSMYKKTSHEKINISSCKICDEKFDFVIKYVNEFFDNNKVLAYNEKTKTGYAKHIVARIIDNQLLLTFVFNKFVKLNFEKLYLKLKENFNEVGINLNINKSDKEIISNKFIHIIGIKNIEFKCFNTKQQISNGSFLQINLNVQNKLYDFVLKNINGQIVNAYSGAGLLTSIIAKNNKENIIYGLEINKEATILADNLCKTNDIQNIKNLCGDANKLLRELKIDNYNLIVDPPRKGLSDEMIKTILDTQPKTIVYISCSPNSLAKNFVKLKTNYKLEKIKAFDMFPQTVNVETVVVLERK